MMHRWVADRQGDTVLATIREPSFDRNTRSVRAQSYDRSRDDQLIRSMAAAQLDPA